MFQLSLWCHVSRIHVQGYMVGVFWITNSVKGDYAGYGTITRLMGVTFVENICSKLVRKGWKPELSHYPFYATYVQCPKPGHRWATYNEQNRHRSYNILKVSKYAFMHFLKFERGAGIWCIHAVVCIVLNVLFAKFTSGIRSYKRTGGFILHVRRSRKLS